MILARLLMSVVITTGTVVAAMPDDSGGGGDGERAVAVSPVCSLPPVNGPCRGMLRRYYFDTTNQTCQDFIYGGDHILIIIIQIN